MMIAAEFARLFFVSFQDLLQSYLKRTSRAGDSPACHSATCGMCNAQLSIFGRLELL